MNENDEIRLILASASPRRRELLGLLELPFEVKVSGVDETPRAGEPAMGYVQRVAREKAEATSNHRLPTPPQRAAVRVTKDLNDYSFLVIAADTEVVCDGEILGKPKNPADAAAMLKQLRGRTHTVMSAIALLDARSGQARAEVCCSEVPMRNYSDAEIDAYVASGDPSDKAGAYAIQHAGFQPVEKFGHCYASVMGLPLCHLTRALRSLGVAVKADVPTACQQFNRYECPIYMEILAA